MSDGYYYLATPYSRFERGLNAAWRAACEQAALLMRAGITVYCPIAHSHPIAELGKLDPLDHGFWLPQNEPMMRGASGMIECHLPGWERSVGMLWEREWFLREGRPVYIMEPGVVPHGLRA